MHETLYTLPLKSLQSDINTLEPYRGSVLLVDYVYARFPSKKGVILAEMRA